MKLLFFIYNLTGGGAERVLSILANNFVSNGNSVRVVYTSYLKECTYQLNPAIEEINLFGRSQGDSRLFFFLYRVFIKIVKYIRIRRQVQNYKPDIVISFLTPNNNDVILSLLGNKTPLIVCEHSKFSRYYGFVTNLSRFILYRFATAITVLTEKDYEKYKIKYPQLYYLPNPVQKINYKERSVVRNKIVLAAGRVNQWKIKGFDTLINCWNDLADEYPDWKCQIVGAYSESSINELKKAVKKRGFEKVEFLGFRKDIANLMASSEVFCLTSRIEGFPMVLVEAMNARCCCISFDVCNGPSEIIEDNKSGLLVKNQDVEELKDKLRLVINCEELRRRLSSNTINSIEKYSIDRILERWNHLFLNINKH